MKTKKGARLVDGSGFMFAGTALLAGAGVMLSLAFESCSNSADNENEDLTEFVDPMIGTDFTGNTYPGAQMPFGMVQLSPDNVFLS